MGQVPTPALEREPNETEGEHETGGTMGEKSTRAETDGGYTCPLCGLSATDETEVYVHLQTGHRKSHIARAVVENTMEQ
jgi:hypothetical protein